MLFPYGVPRLFRCSFNEEKSSIPLAVETNPAFPYILAECNANSINIWSNGKNRNLLGTIARHLLDGVGTLQTEMDSVRLYCDLCWEKCSQPSTTHKIYRLGVCIEGSRAIEVYSVKVSGTKPFRGPRLPWWVHTTNADSNIDHLHTIELDFERFIEINEYAPGMSVTSLAVDNYGLYIGSTCGRILCFNWDGVYSSTIPVPKSAEDDSINIKCVSVSASTRESIYDEELDTKTILSVCYQDGSCYVLVISPLKQEIDHVLELKSQENVKALTCSLCITSDRLAVGFSDNSVLIFHLKIPSWKNKGKKVQDALKVDFLSKVTNGSWCTTGGVRCLKWSQDGQSIAIGYVNTGLLVSSILGGRMVEVVPQKKIEHDQDGSMEYLFQGIRSITWGIENYQLTIVSNTFYYQNENNSTNTTKIIPAEEDPMTSIFQEFECVLQKDEDGLCLRLAGQYGKSGCWIENQNPFTCRPNGKIGPAEASKKLQGGDILLSINGIDVKSYSFDEIIKKISELKYGTASIGFGRIDYEMAFDICGRALLDMESEFFRELSEDEAILEYSLRMQGFCGDCNGDQPSLFEFEKRAKYDGWKSIQGLSSNLAKERYVRFTLSLLPWDPKIWLFKLMDLYLEKSVPALSSTDHVKVIQVDYRIGDIFLLKLAKSGISSSSVPVGACLLSSDTLYTIAASRWDASEIRLEAIPIPSLYRDSNWPLRFASMSSDGNRIAVAGIHGLALYSRQQKWRLFGDFNQEKEISVLAMKWILNDIIVIAGNKENQESIYTLTAYPRNHLDEASKLFSQVITNIPGEYPLAIELNSDCTQLYCLLNTGILIYGLNLSGSISEQNIQLKIQIIQQIHFPICNLCEGMVTFFLPIPRLERQIDMEENSEKDSGWLSFDALYDVFSSESFSAKKNVLPRFALLDSIGNLILWDPMSQFQSIIEKNVIRIFPIPNPCDIPIYLRPAFLVFGLHGSRLWLPSLDGIPWSSNSKDENESSFHFLRIQDPLRKEKNHETSKLNTTLKQYGIDLCFSKELAIDREALDRGFSSTLDLKVSKDYLLEYDLEIHPLGIHADTGLLISGCNMPFMPRARESGPTTICFDIDIKASPILHMILRLLFHLQCHHIARQLIHHICSLPLATATFGYLMFSMLEDNYRSKSNNVLNSAIDTLKDLSNFTEIVSQTARKVEPNRLEYFFPNVGDPMELFTKCLQEEDLRTAANFLLVLESSKKSDCNSSSCNDNLRNQGALSLFKECLRSHNFHLALQVVRVSREWGQSASPGIENELSKFSLGELIEFRLHNLLCLIERFQVNLPYQAQFPVDGNRAREEVIVQFNLLSDQWINPEILVKDKNAQVSLKEYEDTNRSKLRILLEAVTEARYTHWISIFNTLLQNCDGAAKLASKSLSL